MEEMNKKRQQRNAGQSRLQVYYDATNFYIYVCDAPWGSALTDSVWRIQRLLFDSWTFGNVIEIKTAVQPYWCVATDLATVEALTYN